MKDKNAMDIINIRLKKVCEALKKNNMEAFIASDKAEALEIAKKLLGGVKTVTMGGSVTAAQCGITDYLKNGGFEFLDRSACGITPEEIDEIYRNAFFCDAYVSGSNAITERGELYNVDGNSNRVAAMLYGPRKLIVVAGYNKIVANVDEAAKRVKEKAAPPNCVRLGIDNYCAKEGKCVSLEKQGGFFCDGCGSDSRICRNFVVMGPQKLKDRVKVILVAEELGY